MKVRSIVVLSFTRMGDLIQSTPLLRGLRMNFPAATLSIVVLKQFVETAKMLAMVDHVVGFDIDGFVSALDKRGQIGDAYQELQRLLSCDNLKDIDLLINLSHTKQSATLCSLMNPKQTIGMHRDSEGSLRVNNEWINYLLSIMDDRRLNPFNLVEIYQNLSSGSARISELELTPAKEAMSSSETLLLEQGIDLTRPCIALQPGASHPSRCWPPRSFAELAKRLSKDNLQVIILGDKSEQELADNVCRLSRGIAYSVAGKTTIEMLASILSRCELLISNDTGTAHIASAVKTPVVAMFIGPASSKDTAPFGNGHIILEADLACAPCGYKSPCSNPVCKSMVDVETVYQCANSIIANSQSEFQFSRGLKVSMTVVARDGGFRLQKLCGGFSETDKLLSFYREFWKKLLLSEENEDFTGDEVWVHNLTIAGLENLQGLFDEAMDSINKLHALLDNGEHSHEDKVVLEMQSQWQSTLREMLRSDPDIAPFIQFLLVKFVLARTTSLSYYCHDLVEIMHVFKRGLSLLERMQSQNYFVSPLIAEQSFA